MFRQSDPGSPLACREQNQYCFTGKKGQQKCTSLQSSSDAIGDMYDMLDEGDEEWLSWLFLSTFIGVKDVSEATMMLGTHALLAKNKLDGPLLGTVPDNQWQLEVQHWHATSMARVQGTTLRMITGYKDPRFSNITRYPNTTIERELCASQVLLFIPDSSSQTPARLVPTT